MVNTGYVLFDCKGIDLAVASKTIEDIYNKAVDTFDTGKVIYLTNVVNGTSKLSPIPVYAVRGDVDVVFNMIGKTITITNTNTVSIS